jgi:hypothetical protein
VSLSVSWLPSVKVPLPLGSQSHPILLQQLSTNWLNLLTPLHWVMTNSVTHQSTQLNSTQLWLNSLLTVLLITSQHWPHRKHCSTAHLLLLPSCLFHDSCLATCLHTTISWLHTIANLHIHMVFPRFTNLTFLSCLQWVPLVPLAMLWLVFSIR